MADTAGLLDVLFGDPVIDAIFSGRAALQAMLDTEAALARGEERLGIIPKGAAKAIAACCDAGLYDIEALARETAVAGTPVIPLARMLAARVAEKHQTLAPFAHWGATSQDIIDTGLILQARTGLDHIERQLALISDALASLADKHRKTLMAGRTLMQHAVPTVFGLKAAGWLSAVSRHRERISQARPRVLALQFGGAAGTLASLGKDGPAVARELAKALDLTLPDAPWHALRDSIGELAALLALISGTLAKIGRDITLMMATETAEVFEPAAPGKGGSSAMPHKRNPVAANVMIAAGVRAPALAAGILSGQAHEHERGGGLWHAEWQALPELFRVTGGALRAAVEALPGLEIDAARMRANLGLLGGLTLAERVTLELQPKLGRSEAAAAVEAAARHAASGTAAFAVALAANPAVVKHLNKAGINRLLDPAGYLGAADHFISAALATRRKLKRGKG